MWNFNFYYCKFVLSDFNLLYSIYGFIILKNVLKQFLEFLRAIRTDILHAINVI